jgi:DNA repair exonuclease SbcCD ATPase subunit
MKAFEDFVSYLEEQSDTLMEAQDTLEGIGDEVAEIEKRGRDGVSEIYNQVKEALVSQRQEEIDKLEEINSSIEEAQSKLVDQIQKQIDEARQERENKKTETEIADKERRLAYLKMDTSGANATEIASLEKEIAESRENYTDSLIDQQLEELRDANEKAAEQRQMQIDIANAQLEAYTNSAEIWEEIGTIVTESLTAVANGSDFASTVAGQLIAKAADVDTMNKYDKEDFYNGLEKSAKEGAIYEGFVSITGTGGTNTISGLA